MLNNMCSKNKFKEVSNNQKPNVSENLNLIASYYMTSDSDILSWIG